MPELLSINAKYATVSGFESFQSALVNKVFAYAITQTYIPITQKDKGAFATPDPSFINEIEALVTGYVATETFLPASAKSALISDAGNVADDAEATGVTRTASAHSTATAATGVLSPNGAANSTNGTSTPITHKPSNSNPTSAPSDTAPASGAGGAAKVTIGGVVAAGFAAFMLAL